MSTRRCSVRNNILVEKISHTPLCVPLGTRYDNLNHIPSLTGRLAGRGTLFSTNILSLTGYSNQHFSVDTTLLSQINLLFQNIYSITNKNYQK